MDSILLGCPRRHHDINENEYMSLHHRIDICEAHSSTDVTTTRLYAGWHPMDKIIPRANAPTNQVHLQPNLSVHLRRAPALEWLPTRFQVQCIRWFLRHSKLALVFLLASCLPYIRNTQPAAIITVKYACSPPHLQSTFAKVHLWPLVSKCSFPDWYCCSSVRRHLCEVMLLILRALYGEQFAPTLPMDTGLMHGRRCHNSPSQQTCRLLRLYVDRPC